MGAEHETRGETNDGGKESKKKEVVKARDRAGIHSEGGAHSSGRKQSYRQGRRERAGCKA